MTNYDKYLDPPDEEEAQFCEDCGQELEVKARYYTIPNTLHCVNPFCPSKFHGTAKEMACELADAQASIGDLKRKVAHLNRVISILDPDWKYGEE